MADPARHFRRNATDAECRLWAVLRHRRLQNYKFRRQHPIRQFIVDFACTKHHLVIEADGGQHDQSSADAQRTAWLESQGWRVIRFWNNDILTNTEVTPARRFHTEAPACYYQRPLRFRA